MLQTDPAKYQLEKKAKHYWQACPGAWGGKCKRVWDPFQTSGTYKWTSYNQSDSIKTDVEIFSLAMKDKENIK